MNRKASGRWENPERKPLTRLILMRRSQAVFIDTGKQIKRYRPELIDI